MDGDAVASLLAAEPTRARRVRTLTALLGRESGLGDTGLTLVGGSALEVYTEGEYVSDDVDLVASDRARLDQVLRAWGFRSEGMYWRSQSIPFLVQIVGRYDSGSASRSRLLSTRHGPVRLAAIEDIIVKRLIGARHWNRPSALAEAMLAARRNLAAIDWEYVDAIAKKDGVSDLATVLRANVEPDGGASRSRTAGGP